MKKFIKYLVSLSLAATLALTAVGCGSANNSENVVNVGVTDSLGGVNPFVIDQTEINKYAVGLMFLPLMELDKDLNFQGMLADSVTTEDNLNFVVHIDDNATWSDGTPVTAADVEYTVRRLASPVVNNTTLMLYAFEGIGDDGFVEKGAESISGIQILDEKTIQFTSKYPILLPPLRILMPGIFTLCPSI